MTVQSIKSLTSKVIIERGLWFTPIIQLKCQVWQQQPEIPQLDRKRPQYSWSFLAIHPNGWVPGHGEILTQRRWMVLLGMTPEGILWLLVTRGHAAHSCVPLFVYMYIHTNFFKSHKKWYTPNKPEYYSQSVFKFSREVKCCVPSIERCLNVISICFALDVSHIIGSRLINLKWKTEVLR